MRRYGAPHRVIVSSLNCQAGLNHTLDKVSGARFQLYSVAMRRGCDEAIRSASPRHRFVAELSGWVEPYFSHLKP